MKTNKKKMTEKHIDMLLERVIPVLFIGFLIFILFLSIRGILRSNEAKEITASEYNTSSYYTTMERKRR